VLDRSGDAGLAQEALAPFAVASEALRHHLERDLSLQPGVLGAINPSHSAFTDAGTDDVDAELRSLHECGGFTGVLAIE
jgi:hypothetical protein